MVAWGHEDHTQITHYEWKPTLNRITSPNEKPIWTVGRALCWAQQFWPNKRGEGVLPQISYEGGQRRYHTLQWYVPLYFYLYFEKSIPSLQVVRYLSDYLTDTMRQCLKTDFLGWRMGESGSLPTAHQYNTYQLSFHLETLTVTDRKLSWSVSNSFILCYNIKKSATAFIS